MVVCECQTAEWSLCCVQSCSHILCPGVCWRRIPHNNANARCQCRALGLFHSKIPPISPLSLGHNQVPQVLVSSSQWSPGSHLLVCVDNNPSVVAMTQWRVFVLSYFCQGRLHSIHVMTSGDVCDIRGQCFFWNGRQPGRSCHASWCEKWERLCSV